MRASILVAVLAAGCGRLGFDPTGAASDAMPGDGVVGDGAMTIDSPDAAGGAGAATFITTAASVQNLSTYTFATQPIGPAAANRIVIVCAHLGGGAMTPISSVTLNGNALSLTASVTDTTTGAQVIAYGLVATGTTADITVTSASAGRAAITILNITASNVVPSGSAVQQTSSATTTPISTSFLGQTGSIAIAVAGFGSNNTTWTWGGSWPSPTEHNDMVWSEQGSYTVASSLLTSSGFLSASATPANATGKMISVATWR